MEPIFTYTDYRKLLRDYYDLQKSANRKFSYEFLSRKMGLRSKGFVRNICTGERNISGATALKFAKVLNLNREETDYFETLVAFNQAANSSDVNFFFEKLCSIRRHSKKYKDPQLLKERQFEYYSNYSHSVVRAIIDMVEFKDDFAWMAKQVRPRITPLKAKKSVTLLEKLNLIRKSSRGFFEVCHKGLATPKEVINAALLNFHKKTAELALASISELPREQRNVSGLTVGISKKTYELICDEIVDFRRRMAIIADEDDEANSVYRLNIQLFPVSELDIQRKKS
ncbi:TIGR02147 family protein [Fibrobacterota bacterium]